MRGWLVFVLAACANDGARAKCAEGGQLNACPDTVVTPQDACSRLVDCAAIPLHSDKDYIWDWDNCVNDIERLPPTGQQLTISCIGASTCDQLKVGGSPDMPQNGDFFCWLLGTGGGG